MPSTYYHTIEGRIRGQSSNAGRRDYLTDALGSLTATTSSAAQVENTYRSKPYGDILDKAATIEDPRFVWTGDTGSRLTGLRRSGNYNRARHYNTSAASWTTVDALWPGESQFAYVTGNPITFNDPSGDLAAKPFATWAVSCCGGYVSHIQWVDFPKAKGWIVQKVQITIDYYNCDFKKLGEERHDYFEAWRVDAIGRVYRCEKRLGPTDEHDSWSAAPMRWGIKVDVRTSAAVYIPGTPPGFLKTFRCEAVKQADDLHATLTWSDWDKYSSKAKHLQELELVSSCCECPCTSNYPGCSPVSVTRIPYQFTARRDDCPIPRCSHC